MFINIKTLSITACAMIFLQACHSDDDSLYSVTSPAAPQTVVELDAAKIAQLRGNAGINTLFGLAGTVAGTGTAIGDEPCQVKVSKMSFDTKGGAGEATTSTGVVMVPYGDNAACTGSRPVVLYAHGTSADKDYDLSQFAVDSSNPAASESAMLLAFYASQGYVVIAPNYAGYSSSSLDYHPYVDEVQQSTEMIDALNHVRTYASEIGADLSSKLFVSGVSQGGYVAMATHKALQAAGETVTASAPISGPYMLGNFLDDVMGGNFNTGVSTFAPMYLTALQKSSNIYTNANEVYADTPTDYASIAEAALPSSGATGAISVDLPGDDDITDLFSTDFVSNYGDILFNSATVDNAAKRVRDLAYEGNLDDWAPSLTSPLLMCGANDDPTVYHSLNSDLLAASANWAPLVAGGLVTNLDLTDVPNPANPLAGVQVAWQQERASGAIDDDSLHGMTGPFCTAAALGFFNNF